MKDANKLLYGLFFIFVTAFIIIALKGLITPQHGDENVYYYMGKLITEGKIPYRDFFFAHPPLHIFLIALIYNIIGFKLVVLKSVPLISTLTSALFILKIVKEKFGFVEAIVSSLLFLFSYSVIFNSVFSFGIDIATTFLVIGLYFLYNKSNYISSGIFFGFAGITRLLSLVPIIIIFVIIFLSNKKGFLKLLTGFLAIFLLVNGIFIILFGDKYLMPVYKFHVLKSFVAEENFMEYLDIIKLNWILFSSALLFIFVKNKKLIGMLAIVSIVYLLFLTTLRKIFGFYFVVIFPFLAIIGGYSIVNIFRNIFTKKFLFKRFFLLFLLLIFAWDLASNILFLERIGFRGFERGKDIIDFINLNSNKNTLLFGDDSVVPLLSLQTNKRIALDFVDTNNQVFISGLKDLNTVLSDLKGKEVFFVLRNKQGISSFVVVRDFVNKNCELLSQFHDKIEGDYLVYGCNG